ncbi:translation initiation protein Sua5 [Talaromyces stipitatus ATCC 10500]|uniref:Threonylcarbamoyl-AMP synthase n=1 Tax=Talaromyces stipitatus (strain ATCC 10500 / CBS 375.48 / QM 6759 / NRRL 1006) TaxID=441959 RepID=B8LT22_TALSN|nr:translation initiation protein Sua5 [Talaromyces stipitatus ATCC 10500]EED23530.1 translation initiation protein Sua5 [Talaromyces stipitatus ATCC 10500]
MTEQRQTRILPVQRLNKPLEPNRSIAEWWEEEKSKNTPEAAAVLEAAETLRTSDIPVGFPTETVYGLGADATRSGSVQGIYKAKQRPSDNPLIVHVDSIEMVNRLLNPNGGSPTTKIPAIYEPLISRFWPGALTILLPNPKGSLLAKEVTANLPTFGVRMPSSAFARLLIHVTDRPLAAPSANASTKPSPTTAEHVYHDLQNGGPCGVGVESTVVDGLTNPPAVLRPGGIGIEEIRTCPGWENVQVGYNDSALQGKEAPRSPGMKYRHYSPKARVVLFEAGSDLASVADRVKKDLIGGGGSSNGNANGFSGRKIGIVRTKTWPIALSLSDAETKQTTQASNDGDTLSIHQISVPLGDSSTTVYDVHLGASAESIARGLFATLRSLDAENVDAIYIEGIRDDEGDLAAAVMNRLRKAAEVFVVV